jgi:DNA-binding response OmpR family regulator
MTERRRLRRVLVIDDDSTMRRLLRTFLTRAGYDVLEAPDGKSAVLTVECERVDLVILDKEMPGMNGLEVLSDLHRRFSSIPVIFVTAFGGSAVEDEARRRGARRYVEKPFRVGAIVEVVHSVLDGPPA